MRALVIDDSRAMRRIISGLLTEAGFEVLEAGNGQEALDALAAGERVELALVDWNMPVLDGLEFVKRVRGDDAHARMKIMMVTTETGVGEMTEALDAGADEYVMKPFSSEVIMEKLRLLGF